MNYADWLKTVPVEIRDDTLWNQEVYRLAMFSADLGWSDTTKLFRDGRTVKLAAQLFDAIGSIGANLSEGYSRGHQKDRARFYEYALGSARESRTWYFNGRHILGQIVAEHRIKLQTQIIRLLLKILPPTRGYVLHETEWSENSSMPDDLEPATNVETKQLLESVPMPEL